MARIRFLNPHYQQIMYDECDTGDDEANINHPENAVALQIVRQTSAANLSEMCHSDYDFWHLLCHPFT